MIGVLAPRSQSRSYPLDTAWRPGEWQRTAVRMWDNKFGYTFAAEITVRIVHNSGLFGANTEDEL